MRLESGKLPEMVWVVLMGNCCLLLKLRLIAVLNPYTQPESVSADPVLTQLREAFQCTFELGVRRRSVFSGILSETLHAHSRILSARTVWEPNALDGRDAAFCNAPGHDASGRFVHCWHRAGGRQQLVPVVDYDDPVRGKWYLLPKRQLLACRQAAFDYRFGSLSVSIRGEVAPILDSGRFIGAVGIDLKASHAEVQRARTGQMQTAPLRQHAVDVLSPREREVFYWLQMGKTNEEIGIVLGISRHTVKNHLERVYQKLGVSNRCEAILST